MSEVKLTKRVITIVDPDNSKLTFKQCLKRHKKPSLIERIMLISKDTITVAVPFKLAEKYPAGMTKLDGRPLWNYRLMDGVVYYLEPQKSIEY